MNRQELRDVLIAALIAIAPDVDPAGIDPRANLVEQLDIDSIDFLNIVVVVHDQTGIDVPERDYPKLSTLDGAVEYLIAAQRRATGAEA